MVRIYFAPLLATLLDLLRHAAPATAAELLLTLAELISVSSAAELDAHSQQLLDLCVEALQRAGSPGRARAALTALERLLACARPAALGTSPYERYPALLPNLLALLASEQHDASRSSVVRVLGILGALEPLKYRTAIARARQTHEAKQRPPLLEGDGAGPHVIATHPHHGNATARAPQAQPSYDTARSVAVGGLRAGARTLGNTLPGWGDELSPTAPQHLAAVALWELLSILHDGALTAYHHRVVAALVYVFTSLGEHCAPLLPRVMPTLLVLLVQSPTSSQPAGRQASSRTGGGSTLNTVGAIDELSAVHFSAGGAPFSPRASVAPQVSPN